MIYMKLLLHICCAPCSIMCIKKLREEDIDVTGFWYNTNIHPYMEYKARRDTLKKYSEMINLDVIYKDEYGLREFTKNTINILDNRCRYCYYSRLDEVARYAKENGYDAFCTSLLISPYQKHDLIKELGEALEKKYGIKFYYYDFRPYFKEGREEAKRLGLYMQKYCGCVFSEEERYLNYIIKDKERMSEIRLVKPSTMFQNEIKNYLIEKKREFNGVDDSCDYLFIRKDDKKLIGMIENVKDNKFTLLNEEQNKGYEDEIIKLIELKKLLYKN